jgi:hypothetical protein
MKKLRLFIIVSPEEQKAVDFSLFEYEQVHSIVILDQEDMEENVAQLLDCNLVVNCTCASSQAIQNTLTVARILNREIIHFSKLAEYVKQ